MTDEVCESETFRRSPIELRPTELQIGPVGLETHNLRVMNHVLQYGSREYSYKDDRRGFDQRLYAALPLSYASMLHLVEAAGLEPATRGS